MANSATSLVLASDHTRAFKVVLLGDTNSGKTCLLQRFLTKQFIQRGTTVGAEISVKNVTIGEQTVKLNMWDTGGQERFGCIAPMHYRNANVILVVYDITNKDSFKKAISWIEETEHIAPYCIAIVGNKSDLEDRRAVLTEKGSVYANQNGHIFMEISAKTGENVDVLFTAIARKLIRFIPELDRREAGVVRLSRGFMPADEESPGSRSGCCRY